MFSCPECLTSQKVAFHFLRQGRYAEIPPSLDDSAYLHCFLSPFHQLVDIYVVLFQILQIISQFLFVWVFASISHINIRCNQIFVFCKTENSLL